MTMEPRTLVALGAVAVTSALMVMWVAPKKKVPGAENRTFEGYSTLPAPTAENLAPRDMLGAQVISKRFGTGEHTWGHEMQDFVAGV